jgi:Tfp pilus assembly protein PilV
MGEYVMQRIVQDKTGVTLVEVMMALVIALVVFLALMQTALVGIDSNMRNVLRDEAVSIADTKLNEARDIPFDSLAAGDTTETVTRSIKNIQNFSYSVSRTISDLNADNKQIDVLVTWDWKDNTVANGNPFTHSISMILRRQ